MKLALSRGRESGKTLSEYRINELQCYLCILLPIIGVLVFGIYPIVWSMSKGLYYYTGVASETRFVGMKNIIGALTDGTYWFSWLTTAEYTFVKVAIELFLALIVAVVLNNSIGGKTFYRAVFFIPVMLSVVIIGIIFNNLFGYFGFVNAWLVKLGIIKSEIDWFANRSTAMAVLIAGGVWATIGTNILYFLAALQNVPKEVYESVKLDGAGRATTFFKITIPMIGPVLQTIMLLAINGTLQVNEFMIVTTNGAPSGKTLSVMAYMTKTYLPGFASASVNLGYGSAQALITTAMLCAIAIIYNNLSKKLQDLY